MAGTTVNSFLIALGLMTRVPVTRFASATVSDIERQQSIYYYPVVGILLAIALYCVANVTEGFNYPLLSAAILLAVWVAITGALHLDGLADSWDAYFAHHGDKNSTHRVLNDPANGTMAVVAIVLAMVLKLAGLSYLINLPLELGPILLAALVLPRSFVLLLMLKTPYAKTNGIASGLDTQQSSRVSYGLLLATILLLALALPLKALIAALMGAAGILIWWRRCWMKMIGGYTGDILGAYIEMTECIVLISIGVVLGR